MAFPILSSQETIVLDVNQLKELFKCPICFDLMEDPVIDKCGHTFHRRCIEIWLRQNPTCPLSGQPENFDALIPNRIVAEALSLVNRESPLVPFTPEELSDDEQITIRQALAQIESQREIDQQIGIQNPPPAPLLSVEKIKEAYARTSRCLGLNS